MRLLRSHRELEVYKLSYKLAMSIFKMSKSFPKKSAMHWLLRFGTAPGPYLQISLRLFARDDMKKRLLPSYQTQKLKAQKHRRGWISPEIATTSTPRFVTTSISNTITWLVCLSTWPTHQKNGRYKGSKFTHLSLSPTLFVPQSSFKIS